MKHKVSSALIFCACIAVVNFCYSNTALSQQFAAFDGVAGSTTGEFGWEVFAGNYTDNHTTDALSSGIGSAFLSATPASNSPDPFGGVVAGDLYAHLTTPTYTLDLGSLDNSQSFTSIAVQFAMTQAFIRQTGVRTNLTATDFAINGINPGEFRNLGARDTIPGNNGTTEPVEYFWASWDGLAATTDLDIIVTGIGNPISFDGTFQTLATAKVSYVNTSDANFRITAVPEPGSIAVMLFAAVPFAMRRRRNA